jgi:peptidyl-prolyl cis-trans isomerase D
MLRTMRESSKWIMWLVILGVGAVFVLYLGIGGGFRGSGGPGTVVDVDGRRYSVRDVYRIRQRQEAEYRRALGDDFNATGAGEFLDEMAASTLLRMALMAREAERLGLRVSDQEVRRYLRRIPGAVDDAGRIDKRVITSYAEREYGSVRRFQEALRDELLVQKIGRLLTESVAVSEGEARESLRYDQEEVRIAYVRFDGSVPPEELEVSESQLEAFLASDIERVREVYDERSEEYDRPEQVRARHILVRLPEDADAETEAAAREKMDAILERIRKGADFVDVALEASEDSGSKDEGGDLGFFPRGRMVAPFEEAAFSLEPGTVSEVIRTTHGLHLIRVEEKKAATVVPFEEARDEIARDLIRQDEARGLARARAEALAAAIGENGSLLAVAREAGLNIDRTEAIRRRPDGYVPGLGAVPELVTAAFALTEEEPSSTEIYTTQDDSFVLIQLLDRAGPAADELEALVEGERERLTRQRKAQVEQTWLAAAQESLAESGRLFYSLEPMER